MMGGFTVGIIALFICHYIPNNMKSIALGSFLLLLVFKLSAQQEFYRENGGLSITYGHANSNEVGRFNSVGLGFVFPGGFAMGVASQQIGEEVKPQLYIGYQSPYKPDKAYMRTNMQLAYTANSKANIFSGSCGLSYIFNATSQLPTSLNGAFGFHYISFKNKDDFGFGQSASDVLPYLGASINQALFSNQLFSPVLGTGIGHDFQHRHTNYLLHLSININFSGQRSVIASDAKT